MSNDYACPHCGRTISNGELGRHAAVCRWNPEFLTRMRAVLEDPEHLGHARPMSEYDAIARESGLPVYATLKNRWRAGWPEILVAVRLEPALRRAVPRAAVRLAADEATTIVETVAALQRDAALRDYWDNRGLPVCRVREIDGGRRVACELR